MSTRSGLGKEYAVELREATVALSKLLMRWRCGHPQWYAELLVASAYGGVIQPTNFPAYDVVCDRFGRVQVKSRVSGTDTTQNRSNFGRYASSQFFDYAVIVLFSPEFRILRATAIPSDAVLSLVRAAGHVRFTDAANHHQAVDVTTELRAVAETA